MTKMSYTISDISSLMCVNRLTVKRWIETGKIKAIRDGHGKFYIREADLKDFIIENPKYQKWSQRDRERDFVDFCKDMLCDIYSIQAQIMSEKHEKEWYNGYETAIKEMEKRLKNKIIEHDIPLDCKSRHYSKKNLKTRD